MINIALKESRKLLDNFIDCDEDFEKEEIESIKNFIKALKCGCQCDGYNGFDCGCNHRSLLRDEALKEIDLLIL